jgi:deoxyhypusine synthase
VPSLVCTQIRWRLSDEPITADTPPEQADPAFRAATRAKIYLGYTSNLISAGVREQIRWGLW